jgi:hypothetical protein
MARADLVVPVLRFCALCAAAGLLLALLERRWGIVSRFAAEDGSALNLGVARIVILAVMIWQTPLATSLLFARLDPALMLAPRGWGHLMPFVPLDPSVVAAAHAAFVVAAVLGLIGLWGRIACGLATALAFYLQTIPQLYGTVNHTTNHLIVFGAILALSPCCDALAIDARRGVPRQWADGPAYGFALKSMMLVIGVIYVFPGAWKVSLGWDQWFTAANLSHLIMRAVHDRPPSAVQRWVLDEPRLLFLGTIVTVVFEMGFVFAILAKRVRPAAALAGIGFHTATGLLMHIPFGALQCCYVIFIDWRRWIGPPEGAEGADRGPPIAMPLRVASVGVLAAMVVMGAGHVVGTWPLACYPTFDRPVGLSATEVAVEATGVDGKTYSWTPGFDDALRDRFHAERRGRLLQSFLRPDRPVSERRARALVDLWRHEQDMPPFASVRWFADQYTMAIAPGRWARIARQPLSHGLADLGQ